MTAKFQTPSAEQFAALELRATVLRPLTTPVFDIAPKETDPSEGRTDGFRIRCAGRLTPTPKAFLPDVTHIGYCDGHFKGKA